MTLHLTGIAPNFLKIPHTLYLRDVLGLRLKDAKEVTDDLLAGIPREIQVPAEQSAQQARALRIFGVQVDGLDRVAALDADSAREG